MQGLTVCVLSLVSLTLLCQGYPEDDIYDKRAQSFAFAKRPNFAFAKRMSNFAFAKRPNFAFAKRARQDAAEFVDENDVMEKRARFAKRFAFAKRAQRHFAFAKRARQMARLSAFAKRVEFA